MHLLVLAARDDFEVALRHICLRVSMFSTVLLLRVPCERCCSFFLWCLWVCACLEKCGACIRIETTALF